MGQPRQGMVISLPGVLLRAAESLEAADDADRAYMLRKLLEHLTIVRSQPQRLWEFMELWVDERATVSPAQKHESEAD